MGQRDRIGARAPIGADLEGRHVVARLEVDVDELLDFVANQRDRRLAVALGGDAQLCSFTGRVRLLVERHHGVVGNVGARRAAPADVKRDACLFALARFDVEPMATPLRLSDDFRRIVGADVNGSARDALRRLHRFVVPAAVHQIPLIVVAELIERPAHPFARDALAVGVDRDRLERRVLTFAEVLVKVLPDSDHRTLGLDGDRRHAFDRASARLRDIDDELRLQRLGGVAFGEIDGKVGVAFGVGLNLVGELLVDGAELVVGQARRHSPEIPRAQSRRPPAGGSCR